MPKKKISKKVAGQSKEKKKVKGKKKVASVTRKIKKVVKPVSAQSLPAGRQGSGVAKKKPVKKIKKVVKAKAKIKKAVSKKVVKKIVRKQRKPASAKGYGEAKPASARVSGVARKKPVKKTTRKLITKKTTKKVSKTKKTKAAKPSSAKSLPAGRQGSGEAKKKNIKKRTVSIRKKSSKKIFVTVTEEKYFWVNNGPVLKDMWDLYDALKTINKDQFIYHAHGENNDFALWVEYVLLDKECAKELKTAKTQKTATKKISEVLKKYK